MGVEPPRMGLVPLLKGPRELFLPFHPGGHSRKRQLCALGPHQTPGLWPWTPSPQNREDRVSVAPQL